MDSMLDAFKARTADALDAGTIPAAVHRELELLWQYLTEAFPPVPAVGATPDARGYREYSCPCGIGGEPCPGPDGRPLCDKTPGIPQDEMADLAKYFDGHPPETQLAAAYLKRAVHRNGNNVILRGVSDGGVYVRNVDAVEAINAALALNIPISDPVENLARALYEISPAAAVDSDGKTTPLIVPWDGLALYDPTIQGSCRQQARAIVSGENLQPYRDELEKIAESLGDGTDPFAAWESIEALKAAAPAPVPDAVYSAYVNIRQNLIVAGYYDAPVKHDLTVLAKALGVQP